jgi:hypothetical protein
MSEDQAAPKIGAGHASAMFRQGLSELRAALYPESNVAQPAQYGLYGTRTPGEVMQERGSDARDVDEQPRSALAEAVERAEKEPTREPEPPGMDRE